MEFVGRQQEVERLVSTEAGRPDPNCRVLGPTAEFIIENGGGLTDFPGTLTMQGYALANTPAGMYEVGSDPLATIDTDTSAGAHSPPYMSVGISTVDVTCFSVSQNFTMPAITCPPYSPPTPPPAGGDNSGR